MEAGTAACPQDRGEQQPSPCQTCRHCGASFSSRNALFGHLQERCDPEAREGARGGERKERVLLVVGYMGSRFHGCMRNSDAEEATKPTVEGTIVAAACRAWGGDTVLGVTTCTKTEKGVHAVLNIVILTVRPGARSDDALERELRGTEVWLLAPTAAPPPLLGERMYAVDKRSYNCYVPYSALIPSAPAGLDDDGWLWLTNLPKDCTAEDISSLCADRGVNVPACEIAMVPGCTGNAQLRAPAAQAAELCTQLDGLKWPGVATQLLARPLAEARAKLQAHGRLREALKVLRGPEQGLQSFHSFLPNAAPGSAQAMRSLKHCGVSLRGDLRVRNPGCGWYESDYATVSIAAKSFAPQQLRHMLGAVVAVVRGCEDLSYLHRCFEEHVVPTPAAPAEALALHSTVLHSCDRRWRQAVGLRDHEVAATCREIELRMLAESRQPWSEFVRLLDAGSTSAHLGEELIAAAAAGDAARVEAALGSGARVNATDEYGRSALFASAEAGHLAVVQFLLAQGADATQASNGGSTACVVAAARGHGAIVEALCRAGADRHDAGSAGKTVAEYLAERAQSSDAAGIPSLAHGQSSCGGTSMSVLIPLGTTHAGAGTVMIDGAFDDAFLGSLAALSQRLSRAPKEKSSPTERAYFADSEGWVVRRLDATLRAAALPAAAAALPQMRFLEYRDAGGSLPAHVDLPRVVPGGARTTYSFLLYLSDCAQGGETQLLEALPGDAKLAPSGGVAPGAREVLARVQPRRGRLLLMPHACPHAASATVDVPKSFIRGEILPPSV